MFFSNKIISIKPEDKVLEIGPGSTPYFRSDVLLEKKFDNENEYAAQFGHSEKLITDKKLIFYEGDIFPFKDKEFDYVICSHVLEHVDDVDKFLSEVFRVANKGYFEYPLIYYEYLYNFNVHLNYIKYNKGELNYMKKTNSSLNEFKPVQDFFYESLKNAHVSIINDLLPFMMEGFEWHEPFKCKSVKDISDLCWDNYSITPPEVKSKMIEQDDSARELIKKLIKKLI